MATFVIIDNTLAEIASLKNILDSHGHVVYPLLNQNIDRSVEAALEFFTKQVGEDPIDFLVLDINWASSKYGGVNVYTELIRQSLRRKWKHTLICTMYKDMGNADDAVVKMFMQASFIPPENQIPKQNRREEMLMKCVDRILKNGPDPLVVSVATW